MDNTNQIFTFAYDNCKEVFPYNHEWSNKHGMFDYGVYGKHAPKLANGAMARSYTTGGRRIIFVGTRVGNVVVFDRFADQQGPQVDGKTSAFYYNCNSIIQTAGWFSRQYLDEYEMALAVGDANEGNLGWRIEQLWSAMKKTT